MKYKCADCKDQGFIVLLTSKVECDCRNTTAVSTSDNEPTAKSRPYWFAGYDSYAQYVADMGRRP